MLNAEQTPPQDTDYAPLRERVYQLLTRRPGMTFDELASAVAEAGMYDADELEDLLSSDFDSADGCWLAPDEDEWFADDDESRLADALRCLLSEGPCSVEEVTDWVETNRGALSLAKAGEILESICVRQAGRWNLRRGATTRRREEESRRDDAAQEFLDKAAALLRKDALPRSTGEILDAVAPRGFSLPQIRERATAPLKTDVAERTAAALLRSDARFHAYDARTFGLSDWPAAAHLRIYWNHVEASRERRDPARLQQTAAKIDALKLAPELARRASWVADVYVAMVHRRHGSGAPASLEVESFGETPQQSADGDGEQGVVAGFN